ncbi:MAG: nucleoside-diphosphate kinase, partial [Actinomycetia bacterium]|nr:nucleoside-diphosphate kinase [Actinomycetes bacterium]
MATESTFVMVKPDGVRRGLVGEVISRLERKGMILDKMRMLTIDD